jgi:Domain of unknown function (DUF4430)
VSRLAVILACLLVLAGCGLGEGEEQAGGGVELRVTRDFGREEIGSKQVDSVHEDETVMRLLRSEFDIETRYGGGFVQGIDGLAGDGAGGNRDWFYWVNGIEGSVSAAERELRPGDRVQWDYRDWSAAMRIPAIVGAFPEPLRRGEAGKRRPVRLECGDSGSAACRIAEDRLDAAGVPASAASLGAPAVENILRVVVAPWRVARQVKVLDPLHDGPEASGVFARFAGRSIELLDGRGEVARTLRPGDGTGIVAAVLANELELVWLVTGLDDEGVEAAARALDERKLRDRFAVAVTGDEAEPLPLEGG